jgi:hypothetical protein
MVKRRRRYYRRSRYKPMGSSDIQRSREKLGFSETRPNKQCNSNACAKSATTTCEYCHRAFCDEHSEPRIATNLHYVSSMDHDSDSEKWEKYNRGWQRTDGHACAQYTTWWNKNHEIDKSNKQRSWRESLHRYGEAQQPYSGSSVESPYAPVRPNRSGINIPAWLYQRWMITEVLVVSLILTILITLPIGLIKLANSALSTSLLASPIFLWNFIAICTVTALYSKVASHRAHWWQAATISLVNSTVLLSLISITAITSVQTFLVVLVILFISTFLGLLFGSNMTYKGRNKAQTAVAYLSKAAVSIVLLLLLANAAINAAPLISAISAYNQANPFIFSNTSLNTSISATANTTAPPNTVKLTVNADPDSFSPYVSGGGYYTPGTNATLSIREYSNTQYTFTGWSCSGRGCYQGPNPHPTIMVNNTITETAHFETTGNSPSTSVSGTGQGAGSTSTSVNDAWVAQFFAAVSSARGNSYSSCTSLSNFAKVRFNTMSANYGISHYGYDQDFQSYYGTIYNTYFGEEVLYPSGYSPSGYVSDIQSSAPLHWQELASNNYNYYGYDIQSGPTYEIYGPDGGYALCPVTEIPGPNINVSQYFASYGCSVVVSNQTWFVIELASACP